MGKREGGKRIIRGEKEERKDQREGVLKWERGKGNALYSTGEKKKRPDLTEERKRKEKGLQKGRDQETALFG